MSQRGVIRKLASFLCLGALAGASAAAQGEVRFDESAPDVLRVTNPRFSVTLSKQNGGIVEILDEANRTILTQGSKSGCLWSAAVNRNGASNFTGGCGFSPSGGNAFTYRWDAGASTLQLNYASRDAGTPSVIVGLGFPNNEYFEMRVILQNTTAGVVRSVEVPASLKFTDSQIEAVYMPFLLPGTKLLRQFFSAKRTSAETYPSQRCFADFQSIQTAESFLSIYTVSPTGPIHPALIGMFEDGGTEAGTYINSHRFETNIRPGTTYTSPLVRIQVGSRIEEALNGYRTANRFDRYSSIQEKLGGRYQSMARAPLIRTDFQLFNRTFARWIADLDRVRPPAILMPISFQTGGHDNSYPDLLPPNARYGNTSDFLEFSRAARSRGMELMPHSNYTWWNPDSPTLRGLPQSQLALMTVINEDGAPRFETYGNGEIENGGFVVSPSVNLVRDRVERAWEEWRTAAEVDMIFLDQVGARPWLRDMNPAASNPLEYYDRWLSLIERAPNSYFTTEGGWDRLASRLWGFLGSGMASLGTRHNPQTVRWGVNSPANGLFGEENWEPYPLMTFLVHDKVFFYQHNLDFTSYTENQEILSWNSLFGYHHIFFWPGTPGRPPDPNWVDLAQSAQRVIAARQAGQTLDEFSRPSADLAFSRFGEVETLANWNAFEPQDTDEGQLPPTGFRSRTRDGSVVAGLFQSRFLGQPLSSGVHGLFVEQFPTLVTVRHPLGGTTNLRVPRPAAGGAISAFAVDRDGNLMGPQAHTLDGDGLRFSAQAPLLGRRPSRFVFQVGGDLVCTDSAAFQLGPVSPGQIVSLFGANIGPAQSLGVRLASPNTVAAELGGVRVTMNGAAAPLLFVSQNQVNAVAPYSVSEFDEVTVTVTRDGQTIASSVVPVVNAVPRLYTVTGNGRGQVSAVNEDGRLNGNGAGAARGRIVTLYGTGGGMENVRAADGELARDGSRTLRLPVTVRIDNRPAEVLYAGAAPGFAGMVQFNVRVPSNSARGNAVALAVTIGEAPAQEGLTLVVQ